MNLKPGFFIIFSLLLFSCLITFYLNYQSYELFKQTKYTKLEIAHLETIVSKIKNAAPAIHPVSTNGTFLSAYNDGKEAENYFSIFKYTTQSFENNKLKMTDNPE